MATQHKYKGCEIGAAKVQEAIVTVLAETCSPLSQKGRD